MGSETIRLPDLGDKMAIYIEWVVQLHKYNLLLYALVAILSIAAEGIILSITMGRMLTMVGLKPKRNNRQE